jgi:putative Mn2+ efflux pump MntP
MVLLAVPAFGLDTLGVSAALSGAGSRDALRVAAIFAVFEGGMPVLGALVGRLVAGAAVRPALVAGGIVIFFLGAREASEEWREWRERRRRGADALRPPRPARPLPSGWGLVAAGFSVSIDELALGAGLGAGGVPLAVLAPVLMIQAGLFSWLGFAGGRRVKDRLGPGAELVAALVLMLVGLWFVASGLGAAA